jgi:hypothetical protein
MPTLYHVRLCSLRADNLILKRVDAACGDRFPLASLIRKMTTVPGTLRVTLDITRPLTDDTVSSDPQAVYIVDEHTDAAVPSGYDIPTVPPRPITPYKETP